MNRNQNNKNGKNNQWIGYFHSDKDFLLIATELQSEEKQRRKNAHLAPKIQISLQILALLDAWI